MTREPEDSPGGSPSRPGTEPAPEATPEPRAGRGEASAPPPRNTGAPSSPTGGVPDRTPVPATPEAGTGPQSPPAQASTTQTGILSPDRDAGGDTDAGEEQGGGSPALSGQEWRDEVKRVKGRQAAAQRNGRGRYRRKGGVRPRPGMNRRWPGGNGDAA